MFDRASRRGLLGSELAATTPGSMRAGLLGSAGLHLAAILAALLGLPWLIVAPPPTEEIVSVNLVNLADKTAAPVSAVRAPLPQEPAPDSGRLTAADEVPVPATPPPPPAPRDDAEESPQRLPAAIEPVPRAPVPKTLRSAKPNPVPAARVRQPDSPADDLVAKLKMFAQLHQTAAPIPPSPRQQDGLGQSNLTAASAQATPASDATYSLKDFIRAQVKRRWNPDRTALKGAACTVSVHIVLDPNGRVLAADIVEDPRNQDKTGYRDFARSARNAALLSSPLTVPPGMYESAKDIVVDFDSSRDSR